MSEKTNSVGPLFGLVEPMPLKNFPEGKVTFFIQPRQWVRACVTTASGDQEFYVMEQDGHWMPWTGADVAWTNQKSD